MSLLRTFSKNKVIIKYIVLNYANLVLNVALNLLLIRRLSTYNLGIINIGRAIFNSFDLSHFGVRSGFDRVLPTVVNERKTSQLFSVGALSTVISTGLFSIFWLIYKWHDANIFLPFIIAGICSALVTLYRIFYRSRPDKSAFVRISLYTILFPTVLQVLFFIAWGMTGFIIALVSSYLLMLLFIGGKARNIIRLKDLKFSQTLKYLLNKGFLLYLASFVDFIVSSADRFIVERYMGLSAVGNLSVVIFFFTIFNVFSTNYTEVIMSKIIINKSLQYVMKHVVLMILVMLLAIIFVYFTLPFFVGFLMPKYLPVVSLMRLILLAILPCSVKPLLSYYLHSIDKRGFILITDLTGAVIYLASSIYYLQNHQSLSGIIGLKIGYYMVTVIVIGILATLASGKKQENKVANIQ